MFGTKLFTGVGYPTPVSIPEETTCLTLQVPANEAWWAVVTGLLTTMAMEFQWQQFEGGLDRDVAAARWQQMVEDALEIAATTNTCGVITVPTPFWDEDSDVDDEADPDIQPWYGSVSDPEAAPAELDFVENAAIWAFTGFLAVATIEIGAAPAILFNTIAPRFVLATKRGDLGEIIRILVDGEEAARVDTSSYSAGDVIRTPILADPELSTHEVMIVQVS